MHIQHILTISNEGAMECEKVTSELVGRIIKEVGLQVRCELHISGHTFILQGKKVRSGDLFIINLPIESKRMLLEGVIEILKRGGCIFTDEIKPHDRIVDEIYRFITSDGEKFKIILMPY